MEPNDLSTGPMEPTHISIGPMEPNDLTIGPMEPADPSFLAKALTGKLPLPVRGWLVGECVCGGGGGGAANN